MALSSKPTFVLFPGAFHTVDAYSKMKDLLGEKSYSCILSGNAPSLGCLDAANTDLTTDVKFFRDQVILPLIERGNALVLVLHSYSGASVGGAVQGLSIPERQSSGLEGGILGLICITAICTPAGLSIQDTLQMTDDLAPWTTVDTEKSLVSVKSEEVAIHQFYNHLPATEGQMWAKLLQPQSLNTFKTKAQYAPWKDTVWEGKMAYLMCEDDQSFPLALQQFFVQSGNFKLVESLASSHTPFLDLPEETTEILIKFAESFQQVL